MRIRAFVDADWLQVWPIVREVVRAGETFAYDPSMSAAQAHDVWIERPPGLTVVAVDGDRVGDRVLCSNSHCMPSTSSEAIILPL